MNRDKVKDDIKKYAFKASQLFLTFLMAAVVLDPATDMNAVKVKRSLSMDGAPTGASKKPKVKGKAAEAFKVFLNFLHITDSKKAGIPEASKLPAWAGKDHKITRTVLPSVPAAGQVRSSTTPQKSRRVRTGLSKSWSYFVHDPFDELSDVEDDDKEGNVFFNESYFEDDYCLDYHSGIDEEIASAKSPYLRGIKMGVSSLSNRCLFDKNDSLFADSVKTPCNVFSRNSVTRKASRRKHASLPDVREKSLIVPMASEEECKNTADESMEEIMAQVDVCNHNLGLNIVFDASVLNDTNDNCGAMDMEDQGIVSNLDDSGQMVCEDKIINSDMSVSFSKVEMVDISGSSTYQNVHDASSSDIEMVAACPKTLESRDRALYREKKPLPLNITLTSTPNRKKSLKRISSNLAVFSDCTSNINPEISPLDESDSSDVFSPEMTDFVTGQSRKEANSFPSSSDGESKAVSSNSGSVIHTRRANTKRCSTNRRSVESGYDSCGKPSSSPGTPQDQKQQLHEIDQSSACATPTSPKKSILSLSALGGVPSEMLLNKLDGFLSPPRCARRCLSPRFKFPSNSSPKQLTAVPEISESSSDTQTKIFTKSPSSHSVKDPAVNYSSTLERTPPKAKIYENWQITQTTCGPGQRSEPYSRDSVSNLDQVKKDSPKRSLILPCDKTRQINANECKQSESPACVDKNNNKIDSLIRIVNLEQKAVAGPQETQVPVTPVNKVPTPISTSSPLLEATKLSTLNRNTRLPSASDFVSPVRWKSSPNSKYATPITSKDNLKRRKKQNLSASRFKLSPKSPLFDMNNNPQGCRNQNSDEEVEVISPTSRDYLLLKRAADAIVRRIQPTREMKQLLNMVGLVEYLNTFYLSLISELSNKKIQTVTDLKKFKQESCEIFTPDRLNVKNCISELLIMALVKPIYIAPCADFVFENLHYIVYECPEFLGAPAELILMLLSNASGIVHGAHGFPLAHKDSEREVFRAVVRYLEHHKSNDVERDRKVKKMLLSVTDPRLHFKDERGKAKRSVRQACEVETDQLLASKRPFHEIEYHQSGTFVTTPDTRQEYMFQPFLSAAVSSYPKAEQDSEPEVTTACNDEVMSVCDSAHTLRKLYFSYRRHNRVPYITSIGLQYAHKGRKKMYTVGAPGQPPSGRGRDSPSLKKKGLDSKMHSPNSTPGSPGSETFMGTQSPPTPTLSIGTNTADDSSFLNRPGRDPQTKMTSVKLASGEHVTGVSLQGDAVLHNVEITTNKGRHVRAHGLSDITGCAPWTPIPTPGGTVNPFCLQALYADVRKPSSRTYLRDIGAVWSVLSRPLNDLSA